MDADSSSSRISTDSNKNPCGHGIWESRGILVKCGGFASQLSRNLGQKVDGHPLWSSRFDASNPEAVIQTHLDFLHSGADIILTNTYQSSVEGFMKHLQVTREQSIELIAQSVKLALQAKDTYLKDLEEAEDTPCKNSRRDPIVLASIGPYGAHLHDGSEYTGDYSDQVQTELLQKWHKVRIDTCLLNGVDGLAVETMPCLLEAKAVTELILTSYSNVKFWVSFQCRDETSLANGESFAHAAHTIWRMVQDAGQESRLLAIGVNCVNPNFVSSLFKSLNSLAGPDRIPLIVYSNRGEIYDSASGEWIGSGQNVVEFVPEWIKLGARIVGGCCRVYPADIARIRQCADSNHI
ncbi:uncharacterized protein Dwil_GK24683 [Drosophila willistoni]|uniref:Hcy-binding domain-containing protein n=1 Tax=Drosophila willistoni TaxID=7260 RepID=B4MZM6_DROWI|nr:homocysteine S-methyltransferase 3 [Drosophila willistoni]EDW77811.1 uncharacterized protein Dwil_GK24683 [Drosophila willistoni]